VQGRRRPGARRALETRADSRAMVGCSMHDPARRRRVARRDRSPLRHRARPYPGRPGLSGLPNRRRRCSRGDRDPAVARPRRHGSDRSRLACVRHPAGDIGQGHRARGLSAPTSIRAALDVVAGHRPPARIGRVQRDGTAGERRFAVRAARCRGRGSPTHRAAVARAPRRRGDLAASGRCVLPGPRDRGRRRPLEVHATASWIRRRRCCSPSRRSHCFCA
jgi:hypothetical protein